jgi:hypothetical protein
MDVIDPVQVEKQLRERFARRVRAPTAIIDFNSSFLESIMIRATNETWTVVGLIVIPVGWFLGTRALILESILEADCG